MTMPLWTLIFQKSFINDESLLDLCSFETQLGLCTFCSTLLKKLTQMSARKDEIEGTWLRADFPLVNLAIKILQKFGDTLFAVCDDDVYQNLLCHTSGFIVVTSTDTSYPELEKLLLKELLQPLLWPAMFSSDLLCLIARFGSSELCLQLTNVLSEVLSCWPPWDQHRPEWVYVSWTQRRLISLLSNNQLQAFPSRLPNLSELASDIQDLLNKPYTERTLELYRSTYEELSHVVDFMAMIPITDHCLSEALYQFWQHLAVYLQEESVENSQWTVGLYALLGQAMIGSVDWFNNTHLCNILDLITNIDQDMSLFSFVACGFLKCLANKNLNSDSLQIIVCQKISSLFEQLLAAENPLTRQLSMENFSYFAYLTAYEQIVPNTVANNLQLQTAVKDYFEGVVTSYSEASIHRHVQNLQSNFQHTCKPKNNTMINSEEENLGPNPCKRLKASNSEDLVCASLEKIMEGITQLEDFVHSKTFNETQLVELRRTFSRLNKLIDSGVEH